MPEGDTVWLTARRLHQALAGQPLVTADLRWPALASVDLRGATTLEVGSRGKHILHRLDTGLTLHSHLRMEGQWWIEATGRMTPRALAGDRVRAVLGTQEWTAIGIRLGMLDLVRTPDEGALVGHLGPDLLGADWDVEVAVGNLARDPDRPIGAALLDQRNLAGIGTLYAAESLFLERIPPWRQVGEMDEAAVRGLVACARRLMDANRHHVWQSTTGSTSRGESTYVHGRSGRPCRRCGAQVRVATIGTPPQDRSMFYCPGCQGGVGPTDDGRPQKPLGAGVRQPTRRRADRRSG
jgi:endonuclease VIII